MMWTWLLIRTFRTSLDRNMFVTPRCGSPNESVLLAFKSHVKYSHFPSRSKENFLRLQCFLLKAIDLLTNDFHVESQAPMTISSRISVGSIQQRQFPLMVRVTCSCHQCFLLLLHHQWLQLCIVSLFVDILIQMRNLQDELLASQRTVDDLRTELKGARDALSHYEDVVVPKFEHHTELSRQNEAKLKALLTKFSAERESTF